MWLQVLNYTSAFTYRKKIVEINKLYCISSLIFRFFNIECMYDFSNGKNMEDWGYESISKDLHDKGIRSMFGMQDLKC